MIEMRSETIHLSDAQFADLLMGQRPAEVSAHLAHCAVCSEEAERVAGAISGFERESRLWAERRAATMPAVPLRPTALAGLAGATAAWTMAAMAAVLGTSLGLTHWQQHAGAVSQPVVANAAATEAPVSAAALRADNQLMAAIDGELRGDALPAASDYGLTVPGESQRPLAARKASD